jgi:PAS domain S-box-containing protein
VEDPSGTPTILIVDDDRGLARLIEKALQREGFLTAIATSGQQAFDWLAEHHADLMLLDLKLPDLAGHELIDKLTAGDRAVPFVIITGQGDERVAVDMMKRGAKDYLVKDVQFLEFVPLVVQRAMARVEQRQRLAAAESALKKEQVFNAAVLSASGALMIIMDPQGQVIRLNPACEHLTGRSLDECRGRPFWELFAIPQNRPALREKIRSIVAVGKSDTHEGDMVTAKGDRLFIAWSITPLRGESGEVEFTVASGIDITERKRLEQEILEITEREQKRIGQDLHDGLCQVLAGIDLMSTALQKKLPKGKPTAENAATISLYARQAIEQARMLARGLSPVELEANGLMAALRELARSSQTLFNVECIFRCEQKVLVSDNAKATHIYRIAQEAINNAVKHGKAKKIVLTLATQEDRAKLTVTDDGTGFATDSVSGRSGMGVRSMKHRASVIGGSLEIISAKSQGVVLNCFFPLAQ